MPGFSFTPEPPARSGNAKSAETNPREWGFGTKGAIPPWKTANSRMARRSELPFFSEPAARSGTAPSTETQRKEWRLGTRGAIPPSLAANSRTEKHPEFSFTPEPPARSGTHRQRKRICGNGGGCRREQSHRGRLRVREQFMRCLGFDSASGTFRRNRFSGNTHEGKACNWDVTAGKNVIREGNTPNE